MSVRLRQWGGGRFHSIRLGFFYLPIGQQKTAEKKFRILRTSEISAIYCSKAINPYCFEKQTFFAQNRSKIMKIAKLFFNVLVSPKDTTCIFQIFEKSIFRDFSIFYCCFPIKPVIQENNSKNSKIARNGFLKNLKNTSCVFW